MTPDQFKNAFSNGVSATGKITMGMWPFHGNNQLKIGQMFHPPGIPESLYIIMHWDEEKNIYIIYSFKNQEEFTHHGGFNEELVFVDNLKD